MTIQEIYDLMAEMSSVVSQSAMAKIRQILNLAMRYSMQGDSFSFDKNADLDKEVDRLLIELSDLIMEEAERRALKDVPEEDKDKVLVWIRRKQGDMDLTERMDQHSSNLKYILGVYLADAFAKKMNRADIIGGVMTYINTNKEHFGRGMNSNPMKGMILTGETAILDGFHEETILDAERNGAEYYEIHRGSDYDCPDCDEVCYDGGGYRRYHIYEELPIPVHPRCQCRIVPIYE